MMNFGLKKSVMSLAVAVGLAGSQSVGCSAASSDVPAEETAKTTEAFGPVTCLTCQPKCSWNPVAQDPITKDYIFADPCTNPDRFMWASTATVNASTATEDPHTCVTLDLNIPLSGAQWDLMDLGCSAPVYWKASNPHDSTGDDYANAWVQLCPKNASTSDYMNNLNGGRPLPHLIGGNRVYEPPHTNDSFCDTKLPQPPSGWYWAIPWMDPCPTMNGCMMQGW